MATGPRAGNHVVCNMILPSPFPWVSIAGLGPSDFWFLDGYRWQSLVLIDVSGSDYTNVLLTLSISCVLFTLADTSSPISYQLQSNPCEKAAINTKCHHIFRKFRAHPVLALWAIQTSLSAFRLFTGTVPTSLSSVHQTFDSDSIHLPSAMPSLLCRRDLVQQHTASSIVIGTSESQAAFPSKGCLHQLDKDPSRPWPCYDSLYFVMLDVYGPLPPL
jgi:hypothetical protein